jgi:GDP-L-fucose synthase
MNFWKHKRIVVTGGAGFLGSHLCDLLREQGCEPFVPRSYQYDLRYEVDIERMLDAAGRVDVLFNLAANVGGIGYNQRHPYALFYDNLKMGTEIIHHARMHGVRKLVQVGTVCAYPKFTPVPFREDHLWDGYPEETNAPYGLAKKMLLVQLQAARAEFGFNGIYLLPTNLYGPRDEFDPVRSHVIPALVRKCVEAREAGAESITVWGTGNASRDFLFVRDCARALLLAAEKYNRPEPLNIGSGHELRIAGLVHLVQKVTGYEGEVKWDKSRPDGQPRRMLNIRAAQAALGWQPETNLRAGLAETVTWYEDARRRGAVYNEHALMEEEQVA